MILRGRPIDIGVSRHLLPSGAATVISTFESMDCNPSTYGASRTVHPQASSRRGLSLTIMNVPTVAVELAVALLTYQYSAKKVWGMRCAAFGSVY